MYGGTSGGYGTVTVAAAATQISVAAAAQKSVMVQNKGAISVYVGYDNLVTTANGIEIPAGGAITIDTALDVYGIVSAGTADIRVLIEGY